MSLALSDTENSTESSSIIVPEGTAIKVTNARLSDSVLFDGNILITTNAVTAAVPVNSDNDNQGSIFAGPCEIKLTLDRSNFPTSSPQAGSFVATFQTFPAADLVSAGSTSVLTIPSNSTGNVGIQIEGSADLLNWVVVQPGQFDSNSAVRFFRVRAVFEQN